MAVRTTEQGLCSGTCHHQPVIRPIETSATEGLSESRHLGLTESDSKVTLATWITALKLHIKKRGLGTVFRTYNAVTNAEINLLEEWGRADPTVDKTWCSLLLSAVPNYCFDGTSWEQDPTNAILTPCPFDADNLEWSGESVMNSITVDLWKAIEKETGPAPDGPLAFATIVRKIQQISARAICNLVDELKIKSIKRYPRENVDSLADDITELCRRIEGTGSPPPDLSVFVAKWANDGICSPRYTHL